MLISVYKSKITYAKITQTDLYYEGSITIDENLLKKAGILENERVQVVNLNNGERLETYVIKGARGSNIIGLNGPAARKGEVGDKLFIISYALIDPEIEKIDPVIVDMRDHND